jgi:penicillin-binding protein 1A
VRLLWKLCKFAFGLGLFLMLAAAGAGVYVWYHYGQDLPDESALARYVPSIVTRVHAGDGRLLAEFAIENRVFVPIDQIPPLVRNAFIAAEDQHFYNHPGIDPMGIMRAGIAYLKNYGSGERPQGASTITQQVAKNFFLTNEVSIERKLKEMILAFRIESTFTKDQILELYLNEINLGAGNWGVVTAALNYFNKSLDELTVGEAAYLAALPKAPNNYHPVRNKEAATERRDYVIDRMLEDGYITAEQAAAAKQEELLIRPRDQNERVAHADYFAEEVRREIKKLYGDDVLYKGGLVVRSTLDPKLQAIADTVLRQGMIDYDRRHGWRGPFATMAFDQETMTQAEAARDQFIADNPELTSNAPTLPIDATGGDWISRLPARQALALPPIELVAKWEVAVVLGIDDKAKRVTIGLDGGAEGTIPMPELKWARAWREEQRVGNEPGKPSDVLKVGDVIVVEPVVNDPEGKPYEEAGLYALRQVPDVEGGLVAMDPHTGRVFAMTGGWSFEESEFNRSAQADRQPGSSFKPFVYAAALDAGFTPATIILDAPFVMSQGPGLPLWRPKNYSNEFYGPTVMRVGIEKSRNLMTVRLAQTVGMDMVVDYAKRFGVIDDMPAVLSMALGSAETTVLRMVAGYSMFVNGGKKITPTLIDRIQDRYGHIVYRHDTRACDSCIASSYDGQPPPVLPDEREQIVDPISAYQMVYMLEGVVQRGTGTRLQAVGKPIAGKTGTTNDNFDAWFIGFTPDLTVGAYIGFDQPRTLGPNDTGSTVASPIIRDFFLAALEDVPGKPFRVPPGVVFVPIDQSSGMIASGTGKGIVLEAFKPGTEPVAGQQVLDGGYTPGAEDNTITGVPSVY